VADQPGTGGATPPGPNPTSGATPGGQQQPAEGATPTPGSSTEGATPDMSLGDAGQVALDRERDARREAERKAAEYRRKLTELQDAGKPELERVQAQLARSQTESETHVARITELEAEIQRRDLDAIKLKVAAEHDLPPSVAARLQGTDLRSLRADAKELREQLSAGTPAGSFGVGQGGSAAGGRGRVDMNTLIREAAGR
jgi:hypothetical protein